MAQVLPGQQLRDHAPCLLTNAPGRQREEQTALSFCGQSCPASDSRDSLHVSSCITNARINAALAACAFANIRYQPLWFELGLLTVPMDSPLGSSSPNSSSQHLECRKTRGSLLSRLKRQLDTSAAQSPPTSTTEHTSIRLVDKLKTPPSRATPPLSSQDEAGRPSCASTRKR